MMRSLMHRAAVVAGAVAVGLVAMAGAASASATVTLAWSPSGTVSYGTLNPGATGAKVFTLTNHGTAATSALNITLTPAAGTPAAAFTITADHCTGKSLGPGKSCTVNVSYTAPAGLGQSSQATLTATGPGKPAVTAPVTLTGATPKATPAITTTAQPGSVVVGGSVADKAAVTGGANPTGTITFALYDNKACSGTALFTDTQSLAGGGATSNGYTTATASTDYWQATYNGDNSNTAATGCAGEPVSITPAITTTSSPGGPAGTATVTDMATISGGNNPTGTLTFNLYGPTLSQLPDCSGTPVDTETMNVTGNGSYTTPAGATPARAGTYWWTASYSGDARNPATGSGCGDEPVTITGDLTLSPGDFFDTESPNLNTYRYSLGGGPATQTFTITNNGNSSTEYLGLDLSNGTESAGFSIGTDNCSFRMLDPGGTCTFDVTFTPRPDAPWTNRRTERWISPEPHKACQTSLTSLRPSTPTAPEPQRCGLPGPLLWRFYSLKGLAPYPGCPG